MERMMSTENGLGHRTILPEDEIAELKERIAALEKANNIMREGLCAAKEQSEVLMNAENGLRGLALSKNYEIINSALRASGTIESMLKALDTHKETLVWP